jgi:hypothetical protein
MITAAGKAAVFYEKGCLILMKYSIEITLKEKNDILNV